MRHWILLPVFLFGLPSLGGAQPLSVLQELSQRSQIDEASLKADLANCDANQRSLNLCAFYKEIEAEMALRAIGAKTKLLSDEDFEALQKDSKAHCLAMAEEEAGGGSIMPMLVSLCVAEDYNIRAGAMSGLEHITPPPPPPHHLE